VRENETTTNRINGRDYQNHKTQTSMYRLSCKSNVELTGRKLKSKCGNWWRSSAIQELWYSSETSAISLILWRQLYYN